MILLNSGFSVELFCHTEMEPADCAIWLENHYYMFEQTKLTLLWLNRFYHRVNVKEETGDFFFLLRETLRGDPVLIYFFLLTSLQP